MPRALLVVLALALFVAGCATAPPPQSPAPPRDLKSPFTGFESAHYKDIKSWLCLPGRTDACARDLDATEFLPDGTHRVAHDPAPTSPQKVDCFYVYPTVDLSLGPGNHDDFTDVEPMARATVAQAARFRDVCTLYVPLYRQVTIGTYFRRGALSKPYFDVAASDVIDAFLHYMGQYNRGRKVVLLGHSQGGQILVRILQRFFDDDPVMREKLLLAMPIGWPMDVAKGKTTGGTFQNLPMCTHVGETACVVGFRSYVEGSKAAPGHAAPPPDRESICVNPAELAYGSPRAFTSAFIPASDGIKQFMRGLDDVKTPFALFRDYYTGRCTDGSGGFRYLAISAAPPSDHRVNPIDWSGRFLNGELGLHIYDYQFTQGDLIELVRQRVAALP